MPVHGTVLLTRVGTCVRLQGGKELRSDPRLYAGANGSDSHPGVLLIPRAQAGRCVGGGVGGRVVWRGKGGVGGGEGGVVGGRVVWWGMGTGHS